MSMKLCAHLGFQFTEFQGIERLEQAARAKFKAVEWPAIYDFEPQVLATRSHELGLSWVQTTLPMGNAAQGEKGLTALADRHDEYLQGLALAVRYAKALGATWIHPMAGVGVSLSDPKTMDVYLSNLKTAIEVAQANGLRVMIEVISQATVPGYAMCTYELAAQVCETLPEIHILIDAFHAQTLTGDPAALVRQWAGRIAHVQIADAPGRHEPGTGNMDFQAFVDALRHAQYDGWVGCEYKPLGHTIDGLHRLDAFQTLLSSSEH